MAHVQVIVASVRPGRIGDRIGRWVIDVLADVPGFAFELVDLKEWHLPLDDEPHQPKHGSHYLHEHTRAWSAKIAAGQGYVFVTPQYNWGYPASLKNALDHLYHEWTGKPAMIVSYGARGGGKAAEQLRQVLLGLHMRPGPDMPALPLKDLASEAGGEAVPLGQAFSSHVPSVRDAFAKSFPDDRD